MVAKSFVESSKSLSDATREAPGRGPASRHRLAIGALALCGIASAPVVAQHVHGVINLGVVVEDDTVAITLNAPLSDVIGFEHAPTSEDQEALAHRAYVLLSSPDDMFGLADSANCSSTDVSIDGPAFLLDHEDHDEHEHHDGDDHHDEHDHHDDHDDHDHHNDHSDHDGHDDHEDHDDHGDHGDHEHHDDNGDEHAEVTATYEWSCDDVSDLESLGLGFVRGFADIEEIEVQILTPGGVRVFTAGRDDQSISLETP